MACYHVTVGREDMTSEPSRLYGLYKQTNMACYHVTVGRKDMTSEPSQLYGLNKLTWNVINMQLLQHAVKVRPETALVMGDVARTRELEGTA
jgi:hypothetical protein